MVNSIYYVGIPLHCVYWFRHLDYETMFPQTLVTLVMILKASSVLFGTLAALVHVVSKDVLKQRYCLYAAFFVCFFCFPTLNAFTDPVTEGAAIAIVARRFLWVLTGALLQWVLLKQVSIGVLLQTLPGLVCYLTRCYLNAAFTFVSGDLVTRLGVPLPLWHAVVMYVCLLMPFALRYLFPLKTCTELGHFLYSAFTRGFGHCRKRGRPQQVFPVFDTLVPVAAGEASTGSLEAGIYEGANAEWALGQVRPSQAAWDAEHYLEKVDIP